jgi:hypothetical protein
MRINNPGINIFIKGHPKSNEVKSPDLEPQLWLLPARSSSPSPRLGGRSTRLLQQQLLVLVRRRGSGGALSSEARHSEQLGEGMGCSTAASRRLLEQTARSRLLGGRPIKKIVNEKNSPPGPACLGGGQLKRYPVVNEQRQTARSRLLAGRPIKKKTKKEGPPGPAC